MHLEVMLHALAQETVKADSLYTGVLIRYMESQFIKIFSKCIKPY